MYLQAAVTVVLRALMATITFSGNLVFAVCKMHLCYFCIALARCTVDN